MLDNCYEYHVKHSWWHVRILNSTLYVHWFTQHAYVMDYVVVVANLISDLTKTHSKESVNLHICVKIKLYDYMIT